MTAPSLAFCTPRPRHWPEESRFTMSRLEGDPLRDASHCQPLEATLLSSGLGDSNLQHCHMLSRKQ